MQINSRTKPSGRRGMKPEVRKFFDNAEGRLTLLLLAPAQAGQLPVWLGFSRKSYRMLGLCWLTRKEAGYSIESDLG